MVEAAAAAAEAAEAALWIGGILKMGSSDGTRATTHCARIAQFHTTAALESAEGLALSTLVPGGRVRGGQLDIWWRGCSLGSQRQVVRSTVRPRSQTMCGGPRDELKANVAVAKLLALERPKADGEESEPESVR